MKFSSKKIASLKSRIATLEKKREAARKASDRAWRFVRQAPKTSVAKSKAWQNFNRADDLVWKAEQQVASAEYDLVCYLWQWATPKVQRWVKSELVN